MTHKWLILSSNCVFIAVYLSLDNPHSKGRIHHKEILQTIDPSKTDFYSLLIKVIISSDYRWMEFSSWKKYFPFIKQVYLIFCKIMKLLERNRHWLNPATIKSWRTQWFTQDEKIMSCIRTIDELVTIDELERLMN